MATMMRYQGVRGFNVEMVAEWAYSDKPPAPAKRPAHDPKTSSGAAEEHGEEGTAGVPTMRLTYTDGHTSEVTGDVAVALHRYFCSVGSSLT